ncbi:hypothetical protein G9A89_008675 [Geosiphon pyriformis]|nr:hypothetical protein G9A89_008675 [Geosiphon pyriformis]
MNLKTASANNLFVMDLKAASNSSMSIKKALKGAFHDLVGGTFSQKKKVSVGNIKHFGDEKEIFLTKPSVNDGIYLDMDNELGNNELSDAVIGFDGGSFLNSAVTTSKAKRISNDLISGSPIVVKTQIEMFIKKSFALDINFLAVEDKSVMTKTQFIRKKFSNINENINKTASLTKENKIIVNTNLKKLGVHSDWTIVIKKIPIDTPKEIIVTAVTKFGEIKLIRIQLIGMWQKTMVEFAKSSQADQLASKWSFLIRKDSVHVAKAVDDHDIWAFNDWFRALLFTLPVETTAHDLGTFLDRAGRKTCIINQSLVTDNRVHCAVIGFESEVELDSVFHTEPIFGGVQLLWARLDLIQCKKCGRFGYSVLECDASNVSVPVLSAPFKRNAPTKLYAKKNVPISCLAVFGDKLWAQVVSLDFSSGSSSSDSGHGFDISSSGALALGLNGGAPFFLFDRSPLDACLASLKCSLELLADQVSGILRKLSFVELVPIVLSSGASSLIGSMLVAPVLDLNMVLDGVLALFSLSLLSIELDAGLNSSSSKVLTTKVGSLESKMSALKASVGSVLVLPLSFVLMSDLVWKFATCNVHGINVPAKQEDVVHWHRDSGILVAIIMNNFLACYVSKVKEVPSVTGDFWSLFLNVGNVDLL